MRRENDMAHVIHSHMPVDTVVSELVGHDTPRSIIHQNIKTICVVLDLLSDLLDALPVAHVALEPFRAPGLLGTEVFCDGILGAVDDFLGDGEDVNLGYVMLEEGVSDAVADAFAAPGDDGYLACLVRTFV